MPYADTDMMQSSPRRNLAHRRRGRTCCSAPRPGRMAHDGQARRARQHHADLPAFPRPGAEPGRERLAVSPPKLALKHRLRKPRRDRRCSMRRLAKTHRSTRNHRVHRNARLGSCRSAAMTFGITFPLSTPRDIGTTRARVKASQTVATIKLRHYPIRSAVVGLIFGMPVNPRRLRQSVNRVASMYFVLRSRGPLVALTHEQGLVALACCRFRGRAVKLIRPSFRTQPG